MEKATITCQYVNEPKSPKGPGSVKDSNGNYWKCWKETLGQFAVGQSFDITYEPGTYQGKPSNTVLTVKPSAKAPEQVAPKAQQASYTPKYGATDMATAERIFVAGMMNNYVGNPNTAVTDLTAQNLIALTNTFRQVWANTFSKPTPRDDMNDELPETFR